MTIRAISLVAVLSQRSHFLKPINLCNWSHPQGIMGNENFHILIMFSF